MMTLVREIRKATRPKKLVHYAVLLCVMWISYRLYAAIQGDDGKGRPKAYGPRDIGLGRGGFGGAAAGGGGPDYDDVGQRFDNLDDRLKDLHHIIKNEKKRDVIVEAKARPVDSPSKQRDTVDAEQRRIQDSDILQDDAEGALQVDDEDNDFAPENDWIRDHEKLKDPGIDSAREGERQFQQQQQQQRFQEAGEKSKYVKDRGDAGYSHVDEDAGVDEAVDAAGDSLRFHDTRRKARDPAAAVNEKFLGLAKEKVRAHDAHNFPPIDKPGQAAAAVRLKFNQRAREKVKDHDKHFQAGPKPVDWNLEEELRIRRREYLANVKRLAEPYDPKDFENMQERDDHLAFVTAFLPTTRWKATLQFIYSVQYFYPNSPIGIYDLGLSEDQIKKLETFCGVTVHPTFTNFWPSHLQDLSHNLWRPMVWQMGLASYGHIVYIEPERFLMKKKMKDYIDYSLKKGIVVVGRKAQYSPYVVTHPEMYHFLNVDTRKLQRARMIEITMLVMHNAQPIRHQLMRHLMNCMMEEYCVSPPGATRQCDGSFFPNSKKYANCHRYDLSAVNILLNKWFSYNQDEFLVRDVVTATYDGKDVSNKISLCPQPQDHHQEI